MSSQKKLICGIQTSGESGLFFVFIIGELWQGVGSVEKFRYSPLKLIVK